MSNARFNISVSRLYTLTILFFYDSSKLFSKRAFFLLTSSRRVSFLSTTTSRQRSNTRTSSGIHPERIRNSLNNFKRRREPFSSNTINYSNRKTPPSPVVSPDDHHPSRLHTGLTCVKIRAQGTYNRRSTTKHRRYVQNILLPLPPLLLCCSVTILYTLPKRHLDTLMLLMFASTRRSSRT